VEDPRDNSILVSMREQNCVIKFSRNGQLKWILGPPDNWGTNFQKYLLTPVGTPFEWNYAQHAPVLTPQGTWMIYDNGNYRAGPYNPPLADKDTYSRAVEFNINETNMTVSQVWDSRATPNDDRLYTSIIGNAEWLPQSSNVLTTYGYVSYVNGVPPSQNATNATMVRIKETTHDPVPELVFDLAFFDYGNTSSSYLGYFCYRSRRIPDLYAHAAGAVGDLAVNLQNGVPHLQFSADPAQATYAIESSTDLTTWTTVGQAAPGANAGEFDFHDLTPGQSTARYYRVVTQQPAASALVWPVP